MYMEALESVNLVNIGLNFEIFPTFDISIKMGIGLFDDSLMVPITLNFF